MDVINQLDYIDQGILKILIENARESFTQIAKDLNISNSLVHQRVRRMKDLGIILGAEMRIDYKALGYGVSAYVGIITREPKFDDKLITGLKQIPEIIECDFVTGKFSMLLKVIAKDMQHLREVFYEKIHTVEGVAGTESFICFGSEFNRPGPVNF